MIKKFKPKNTSSNDDSKTDFVGNSGEKQSRIKKILTKVVDGAVDLLIAERQETPTDKILVSDNHVAVYRPPKRTDNSTKKEIKIVNAAEKLLIVTNDRAIPSEEEIEVFKKKAKYEHKHVFAETISNCSNWRSVTRAIIGLRIIAEVFGKQTIAEYKDIVAEKTNAQQKSLRNCANMLYNEIRDVEPGLPNSEFNFDDDENESKEESVVVSKNVDKDVVMSDDKECNQEYTTVDDNKNNDGNVTSEGGNTEGEAVCKTDNDEKDASDEEGFHF